MSFPDLAELDWQIQALRIPEVDTALLDALSGGAAFRKLKEQQDAYEQMLRPLKSIGPDIEALLSAQTLVKPFVDSLEPLRSIEALLRPLKEQQRLVEKAMLLTAIPREFKESLDAYQTSIRLADLSSLNFSETYRKLAGSLADLSGPFGGASNIAEISRQLARSMHRPGESAEAVIAEDTQDAAASAGKGEQPTADQVTAVVEAVLLRQSANRPWTIQELVMLIVAVVGILQNCAGPFWSKAAEKWLASPAPVGTLPQLQTVKVDRRRATNGMKIRMNAKFNSPTIGGIVQGEVAVVVKVDGSWTMVEATNSTGKPVIGWVLTRYLERIDQS